MDKFRQVAELIYKRCRGDLLVLLDAQAEVLNRTLVLDEINGAITADIPVHVWLEGAVPPIRIDVEKSRAHDAKLRNRIVNRIKAWHGFESFNARVQRHMEALVKAPEESNANVLEEFVRSSEVWQGRFWFALRVHGCADTDVEALPEAVGRACKDALQRTHVNIDSEILRAKSTVIMTRVTFVVDLAIARVSWLRVAVAAATGWLESQVLHNLTRRNGSAVDNNLPRGDLRVESLAVARELPAWIRNDPDGRPPSIWSGVRPHSSPTPTAQKPSITARPATEIPSLQPPGEARSKHTYLIERERPVQIPEHNYNQGSSSSLTQLCCGTGTNIWSGTSPLVDQQGRDAAPPRTPTAASPNSRQDGLSPVESARYVNLRNAEVCRSLELLTAELQRGKIISGNET
jgi:hypothetical protein